MSQLALKPLSKDDDLDSDDSDVKLEKPTLNASQAMKINANILSAMSAAKNIAQEIESPHELDDGSLEMILYLTQKAIADLKELHQQNRYASLEEPYLPASLSPES